MVTPKTPSAPRGRTKAGKDPRTDTGQRRGIVLLSLEQQETERRQKRALEENQLISKQANRLPLTSSEERRLKILQRVKRHDERSDSVRGAPGTAPLEARKTGTEPKASRTDVREVVIPEGAQLRPNLFEATENTHFISIETLAPEGAKVETPGISGGIDEGLLNKPFSELLTSWGVPKQMHLEMAAELEHIARARTKAALRPKWEERGKYAELKDLSAPQFLKRVYADEIGRGGSIKKAVVRNTDPALMSIVEAYISGREARGRGMGDAEGLRFVTSNAGRPKRADLG